MINIRWSKEELDGFHEAAQSLKLYRRAEIQREVDGTSLIEELYVDPLPNNLIFQTMMKANTTFIIGRRGTGKSTIFKRIEHEIYKRDSYATAYVDIKSVYESSLTDYQSEIKTDSDLEILPRGALEKILLYKSFLRSIISDIRDGLKKSLETASFLVRLKNQFSWTLDDLFEGLDSLLDDIDNDRYISITGTRRSTIKKTETLNDSFEGGASLSIDTTIKGSLTAKEIASLQTSEDIGYSDILQRVFNIKEFIQTIKKLLENAGIRHLYIFVDDFSELPEDAMKLVVDTLLAPLNNWSNELIKFKVAAYPGRIYYGSIDKTKIDELNLDLYKLYGTNDVADMEGKAVDFTQRLVEKRLNFYCHTKFARFCNATEDEVWRNLFYAAMSNPRNLGHILYYLYSSNLIYNKPITLKSIKDAAQKYYEEKVESYFSMLKFSHETFLERSSKYSLKELLESIVYRARELRSYRGSTLMKEISSSNGRPPTSHFHVVLEHESLLSTLELNFFLTKYYEMRDRDGREVSIFALNYGLCNKYTIEFGRPTGKREYRTYLFERIFDYTFILEQYMRHNQEIKCDNCGSVFEREQLSALQLFHMLCPTCKIGTCTVTNLSKKYEADLLKIQPELLLPHTELGILQTLQVEKRPMFAKEIAEDLDCTFQLVGKRGKFLSERGLVNRSENEQGRPLFKISERAENTYFNDDVTDELEVDEE